MLLKWTAASFKVHYYQLFKVSAALVQLFEKRNYNQRKVIDKLDCAHCQKDELFRFLSIQCQFSFAFEQARASFVDIVRDTAEDDDLFDLDEDSLAYLEQLSDTDDGQDILQASRQHVRQARIAALPAANRKSKAAFLLAPLFKAKPVFLSKSLKAFFPFFSISSKRDG